MWDHHAKIGLIEQLRPLLVGNLFQLHPHGIWPPHEYCHYYHYRHYYVIIKS